MSHGGGKADGLIDLTLRECKLLDASFAKPKTAADQHIAQLAKKLTAVKRSGLLWPRHYEDDGEHTLTTALICWWLAKQFAKKLDAAEIIKMALVHELAETLTGDVSTFNLSAAELQAKKLRDAQAAKDFAKNFYDCPKLVAKFLIYENKTSRESMFVYWIDKIMPTLRKYYPAERAHWLLPVRESWLVDGVAKNGENGNRASVAKWYAKTRQKLLAAGEVPAEICEKMLHESVIWLNWLVDKFAKETPGISRRRFAKRCKNSNRFL